MSTNSLIGRLTKGMVAGFVGTIAMSVSELLEMSVTGREGSTVPGQVGAHLLPGQDPNSIIAVERLNPLSPGRIASSWAHFVAPSTKRVSTDFRQARRISPCSGVETLRFTVP